jgi:hypothetical protein
MLTIPPASLILGYYIISVFLAGVENVKGSSSPRLPTKKMQTRQHIRERQDCYHNSQPHYGLR